MGESPGTEGHFLLSWLLVAPALAHLPKSRAMAPMPRRLRDILDRK